MATYIIAGLIALCVVLASRSYIKKKGSCGDCHCSCPIKEEMEHPSDIHR